MLKLETCLWKQAEFVSDHTKLKIAQIEVDIKTHTLSTYILKIEKNIDFKYESEERIKQEFFFEKAKIGQELFSTLS